MSVYTKLRVHYNMYLYIALTVKSKLITANKRIYVKITRTLSIWNKEQTFNKHTIFLMPILLVQMTNRSAKWFLKS